jgi:hypothetical protein
VRPGARLLCALLLLPACGAPVAAAQAPASAPTAPHDDGRAATASLGQIEAEALAWMSAADPRMAARTGVAAPHELAEKIGMEAVMAEDATAHMRGRSLDLFAFKARARALAEATRLVAAFHGELPEVGPVGSELRRPRLERELLVRLLEEETARVQDEAALGDSAGDLVRAVVATWTPPASPQEVQDRDAWIAGHLLEIRESLRGTAPRTGPPDLDVALYPLERLLAPLQYPRGAAAIAQLRMALDQDPRIAPGLESTERIAAAVRVHLGLTVDVAALPAQFAALEARLRAEAEAGLQPLDEASRRATLGQARELLFAAGGCPPVADSPVRSMAPSPERAAVCGALRALSDRGTRLAAVLALHDEVQLSLAAVTSATPPRTSLMCQPADEDVDSLRRMARERPAAALGPALAAQIAFAQGVSDARIAAWRDLGEVPLDVMARELGAR